MNIAVIIQARMNSSRLPGKVLKKINGKEMLKIMVNRVRKTQFPTHIVIATSTNPLDEAIVNFCKENNFSVAVGPEDNVLERYYAVAKGFNTQIIVRLTADCPLIDPDIIDATIKVHLDSQADYSSNTLYRTYPRGLDVEAFNFSTLEEVRNNDLEEQDWEHVTPYIYSHPRQFKLSSLSNPVNMSHHRWTVDTIEDFRLIETIFCHFKNREIDVRTNEVFEYLEKNPDVFNINSHIVQKRQNFLYEDYQYKK